MVGIEITQYVDGCFPEIESSFTEVIKELTECGQSGNFGEEIHRALFLSSENPEICRGMPTFFYLPVLCFAYAHDAIFLESEGRINEAWALIAEASYWLGLTKGGGVYDNIGRAIRSEDGRKKANALHGRPGGSRDKTEAIRKLWASGKYTSRDICAEQESAALGMSFSTARKALRGIPKSLAAPSIRGRGKK